MAFWPLCLIVTLVASKALPPSLVDSNLDATSLSRRQASFVGVLSNLPTLAPASYCTEVLNDGRHIAHTRTGASCTYNTVGPSRPTQTSTAVSEFGNMGMGTHPTGAASNKCSIYQQMEPDINGQKRWVRVDRDAAVRDCDAVCKAQAGNPKTDFPSAACIMLGEPKWENVGWVPGGLEKQIALGNCSCNNPILSYIADQFINHALPAIAEVTCKTWYTAIQTVVTVGVDEIPGVGAAVGVAVNLAYQASQVAAYSFDKDGAAGAFKTWLENPAGAAENSSTWGMDKLCGNKYTPQEGEDVFSAFSMAAGAISVGKLWEGAPRSFPPPWEKGKGSVQDMLSYMGDLGKKTPGTNKPEADKPKGDGPKPTHKPTDKPSDKPTTEPSANPTRKSKSDSSTSACTRNGKRAPGNGKNDDCDKPTVTIVKASVTAKQQNVETKKCDFKSHTQACAHYYSAIHNGGKNRFTCEDSNERVDGPATRHWKEQHNDGKGWGDYVDDTYTFKASTGDSEDGKDTRCEADEWPPAYFVPKGQENDKEWGQRIRWLPGSENGGAAQLWTSFCSENDGGWNNGQRTVARQKLRGKYKETDEEYQMHPLNPKLIENVKGLKPDHVDKSGKTVTETYNKVTYTRAVFELDFQNIPQGGPPSEANNWYLEQNSCWPKDIVPKDPGFVLLTDDPWYTEHHKDLLKDVGIYAEPPSAQMIDAAKARRGKRPASDDGSNPPKAQKPTDPPKGGQRLRRRERLEMIQNRIVLRDDEFNITRPLTNEEISRHVEITDCEDRFCSKERKQDGGDDSVYVPGRAPRPSANTAVPTLVTRMMPQPHVRRTPLEADVPVITAMAMLES